MKGDGNAEIIRLVRELKENGRHLSKAEFSREYGGKSKALNVSQKEVRRRIEYLIEEGDLRISVDEASSQRGPRKRFLDVPPPPRSRRRRRRKRK